MQEFSLTKKHIDVLKKVQLQPVMKNGKTYLHRFKNTEKKLATELAENGYIRPLGANNPEGRFFILERKGRAEIDPYLNGETMKKHGKNSVSKSEAERQEMLERMEANKAERKASKGRVK